MSNGLCVRDLQHSSQTEGIPVALVSYYGPSSFKFTGFNRQKGTGARTLRRYLQCISRTKQCSTRSRISRINENSHPRTSKLPMPTFRWTVNPESNVELLGSLALSDSSEETLQPFILFPQLPAEIRIKIWESSFVPRRIILKRHSSRPPFGLLSNCALLLVNSEAHQVFVQHYALCFHSLGLKRIYINYALDTLVLAEGLHSLKKMLQQYPRIMRRIQWLDISPNRHSWKFSWGDMDPEPMSSLRLVTITLNTGDWREAHPGEWHSVLHNTPPTIQHLDHMFHFGSEPNSSKLGLLFARRPWTNNTVIYDKLGRNFNLMDPSASLRERFEIRLPELWDLEKQPVRDTLDRDWIAYEVEKWS